MLVKMKYFTNEVFFIKNKLLKVVQKSNCLQCPIVHTCSSSSNNCLSLENKFLVYAKLF